MGPNKIEAGKQLNGKITDRAVSLVSLILGWVAVAGAEFSDIQTFSTGEGTRSGISFVLHGASLSGILGVFFFFGKKLQVIYVNVIKDTFLLPSQL